MRADRYLMYRQTHIKFTNEEKARLAQLKNKDRKNNGMWYAPAPKVRYKKSFTNQ